MGGELRIGGWFVAAVGVLLLVGVTGETMAIGPSTQGSWSGSQPAIAPSGGWASMPAVDITPIASPRTRAPSGGFTVGDPAGSLDERERTEVTVAGTRIWFERAGAPIVVAEPWRIGTDVTEATLRQGPGHYPSTAMLGADGNVGVAGHRTTHGAPFWALDDLEVGDEVHLASPTGAHWVYTVVERAVVDPDEVWVLADDVLGAGRRLLTITTCHPRWSAAQRLVVWAELAERLDDDSPRLEDQSPTGASDVR